MGSLQEEVSFRILPRQCEIRKVGGVTPADTGRQVSGRVHREVKASGAFLYHASR